MFKENHMKQVIDGSRRRLLKRVTLGVVLIPIAGLPLRAAIAADLPLVTADDPIAKALKYVSDASKASNAKPGSKCANCSNYQGTAGSAQGGCLLFPGKAVTAAGWCSSWTAKR
jgi:high potential iron-sulfur protein